jgi:hypothetical protein
VTFVALPGVDATHALYALLKAAAVEKIHEPPID